MNYKIQIFKFNIKCFLPHVPESQFFASVDNIVNQFQLLIRVAFI